MPIPILLKERKFERDYQISSGQIITLKLEEDYSEIIFWEFGSILSYEDTFVFIEDEFDSSEYLFARMYCPIQEQGLGTEAVKMFIDVTGCTLYTRPNDGIEREDGSHLTGDAIIFLTSLRQKGIISNKTKN